MVSARMSRVWGAGALLVSLCIVAVGCSSTASSPRGDQEAEKQSVAYEISLMKDTVKFRISGKAYDMLKTAESLKGLTDPMYASPSEDMRAIFLLSVDSDMDNVITAEEARVAVEIQRRKAIEKYGAKDDVPVVSDPTVKRR